MVEKVNDRKLYHVTATKPYKRALAASQTVHVGETYNPFFQFYENAREYPVTEGDTGAIVQVKAVSWLRQVRDGRIQTTPEKLANIALEVSQHYVMLCRELLMEEIRVEEFSGYHPHVSVASMPARHLLRHSTGVNALEMEARFVN